MSKIDLPDRKVRKEIPPMIFFENVSQQAVWECILKDEIDSGFWHKVRFEKHRYLLARTFVYPKQPGISFPPSQMSFYFDNMDFINDNGYFIAMVMKLAETYKLEMKELVTLAKYVERFIMIDFHDENANYRRIQVGYIPPSQLQSLPENQREIYKQTEDYFQNRGILMEDVVNVLKDKPKTVKEVRKIMLEISEVLKKKVDLSEILDKVKN